jgi:hypothetical protein
MSLRVNYEKYHVYYTPEGKEIEGLEGENNTIYEFVHYNKFLLVGTPIPEGSTEVFIGKEWIEENRYGTKEYIPYNNSRFYNLKNILGDRNYKKYFVGNEKYMVCISKYNKARIYIVPDNIVCGKLDYTLEGRYHLKEIKRYHYIILNKERDSILIRIHKIRYVFIGKVIYEFDYEEKIYSFGDDYIVGEEGKMFIK